MVESEVRQRHSGGKLLVIELRAVYDRLVPQNVRVRTIRSGPEFRRGTSHHAVGEFVSVLVDWLDAQFPNNVCVAGDKVLKGSSEVRNSHKV